MSKTQTKNTVMMEPCKPFPGRIIFLQLPVVAEIARKLRLTAFGMRRVSIRIAYKWANAQVPPTPFQGRSGGERSKRPTRAVVQTYKYYGIFEGLGSVNIDCGTMNRMY